MERVLPILFNTDMVRAILDGRKTVTRQLIKPQPKFKLCYTFAGKGNGTFGYPDKNVYKYWGEEFRLPDCISYEDMQFRWNPPYHADDILYVRETWEHFDCCSCEGDEHGNCPKEPQKSVLDKFGYGCYMYRASDEIWGDAKWHPSIHMPKEAARIWLKVNEVRVERLQEITGEQAKREGIQYDECPTGFTWEKETDMHNCYTTPIGAMQALWNSTIKKSDLDRYGWDANPWVWVIEFERCEKPENM